MYYLSTCLSFSLADCPYCSEEVIFMRLCRIISLGRRLWRSWECCCYLFSIPLSLTGKSYTMIGKDDSMQNLGIIPCAISWLFKLINERKEKTGARFSVRISAVEVWGKEENLRDLLSEVATGSLQDGQSPGVYLCEDPIYGMQVNPRFILHWNKQCDFFFFFWAIEVVQIQELPSA